jgi:peptide/nickel transport system permease protein
MPGDYIQYLVPYLAEVNLEASELFRHQFGLDKPLIEQYFIYIYNVFHGNWGYSFQYGVPVLKIISEKLYWTLIILLPSTFLSIVIGIFMGAHFGWRSGTKKDLSVLNVMIFIRAIPSYWWAIMLILVFGFYFNLFPLGGFISISALESGINYRDVLHHAILPIFTLTLCSIPGNYYFRRRLYYNGKSERIRRKKRSSQTCIKECNATHDNNDYLRMRTYDYWKYIYRDYIFVARTGIINF